MPAKSTRTGADAPLGASELARILDVSRTTVDRWRSRGCPTVSGSSPATFLVSQVFAWRLERAREEAERDDEAIDLERIRKRRAVADCELAELALEEARSEVVPLDIVCDLVGGMLETVRAKLLAIPGRYSARLARLKSAPKCKKLLQGAVREILDELASGEDVGLRAAEEGKDSPRVRAASRRGSSR